MPNGKSLETAIDANNARAGGLLGLGPTVSYTHSPMFGYNGLTTAPGRRPDASPKIVDQTIVWRMQNQEECGGGGGGATSCEFEDWGSFGDEAIIQQKSEILADESQMIPFVADKARFFFCYIV
ncbi:hypothetical protein QYF36_018171 [Acer negundo]|nr:hypothetical protein QYF36_018171 [Acer negundo]